MSINTKNKAAQRNENQIVWRAVPAEEMNSFVSREIHSKVRSHSAKKLLYREKKNKRASDEWWRFQISPCAILRLCVFSTDLCLALDTTREQPALRSEERGSSSLGVLCVRADKNLGSVMNHTRNETWMMNFNFNLSCTRELDTRERESHSTSHKRENNGRFSRAYKSPKKCCCRLLARNVYTFFG